MVWASKTSHINVLYGQIGQHDASHMNLLYDHIEQFIISSNRTTCISYEFINREIGQFII